MCDPSTTSSLISQYSIAFISPEDLYKAAMQFEVLQLPFRMRQFPSGLLVVQSLYMDDERAAQRVLDRIKEQGGRITSLRLAELENFALAVATEHLMVKCPDSMCTSLF